MRIAHIQLTGPYTEKFNYQENLLPRYQLQQENQVLFLGSCYTWNHGKIVRVNPTKKQLSDGLTLERLPFRSFGSEFLTRKIRWAPKLYNRLCEFQPDFIMMHDYQSLSTYSVCRYMDTHPGVRLVIDCHTDVHNSATNWLSREVLHKLIYKRIAQAAAKRAKVLYYLSLETKEFMRSVYDLPEEKMEYLPLGGIIPDKTDYQAKRNSRRKELGLTSEDVLIVHSGKLAAGKKTVDLLTAMRRIVAQNVFLAVIGSADDPKTKEALDIATEEDSRIRYLGWKSGDDLLEYLCAADIYAQPGTQSATMQNAACCGCAEVLYPYSSYKVLLGDAVLYAENVEQLTQALNSLATDPQLLKKKKKQLFQVACEKLDYKKQAERILQAGATT